MTCWTRVRKTKVLRPLRNKVRQKDYQNMCFRWISDLCHKNPLKQTNQNLIYHMIQLLKAAALVKISRVIPKVKILYGYEFGTKSNYFLDKLQFSCVTMPVDEMLTH